MMDNKDLEAEIHPLKNEERKSQENVGKQLKTEDNLKSRTPQSRLSRCRTVAFFLSLFVCLFVVFVVSFLIPCPERPLSERMWRIDYNASVTYDFLAMEDVNKDRIQDVLFLYKNTYNSNNYTRSCADEGFSTPCAFVAAVSGANGSVLWERPVAQDVALVECAMPHSDSETSACILVGRLGSFIAVNSFTGETLWSHSNSFGENASILSPLLQVPDIDGDGASDLLILTREGKEVRGAIYSGSTGQQIGHRGSLGVDGDSGALLHVTRIGAHYILLPCGASSLCSCSVKVLYEKMTGKDGPFKKDSFWENIFNTSTYGICSNLHLQSSGAVRYLMNVPGKAGEDVLLVSSDTCTLLDGQDLTPKWTLGATQILRSFFWTSALELCYGISPSQAFLGAHHPPACLLQTTAQPSSSGASMSWSAPMRWNPEMCSTVCTCSTPPCLASCWS
ncbi:protein FAM234A isoform X3 [Nannospalax galili]|uniref:protein FAM234A isoform X3 n=1 Tax=Nannospalax galili TaxID=1026970 RepID=UPI0004ED6D8D|nr:protein FAM234A isoform X3 [Nannospalax galili]